MVTHQPLWKQLVALVSCLRQETSANISSARLKAVSKHPKGWTTWKSCMQGVKCFQKGAVHVREAAPAAAAGFAYRGFSFPSWNSLPCSCHTHWFHRRWKSNAYSEVNWPWALSLSPHRCLASSGKWLEWTLGATFKGPERKPNIYKCFLLAFSGQKHRQPGTRISLQSTLHTMPPSSPLCTSLALSEQPSCTHAVQKFQLRKLPCKPP